MNLPLSHMRPRDTDPALSWRGISGFCFCGRTISTLILRLTIWFRCAAAHKVACLPENEPKIVSRRVTYPLLDHLQRHAQRIHHRDVEIRIA